MSGSDRFLQTLDEAAVVDRVDADGVVDPVLDFLATEDRILVPSGCVTDLGLPIDPPRSLRVLSFLTPHQARTLRSKLRKGQTTPEARAARICDSFGFGEPDAGSVRRFLYFLERQHEHFASDDERILMIGR